MRMRTKSLTTIRIKGMERVIMVLAIPAMEMDLVMGQALEAALEVEQAQALVLVQEVDQVPEPALVLDLEVKQVPEAALVLEVMVVDPDLSVAIPAVELLVLKTAKHQEAVKHQETAKHREAVKHQEVVKHREAVKSQETVKRREKAAHREKVYLRFLKVEMNKVLILATVGGFLSRFEMNNVRLLQKMGYEVHYAANMKNRIYDFDEDELKNMGIVLHHVEISKNPFHFVSLIKAVRTIKELIRKEGIGLVHCHTPVGGVIGRMAAQKDTYVIYTAHGFHFYKGAPVLNWLLYYPVEYLLSHRTDCLITINREDYERSQKMKCKKCIQIPGEGIQIPAAQSRNSREEGQFRLISVGELNKNKNHEIVIEALSRLQDPNIRYDIFGKGTCRQNLEELIKKYKLQDQVFLRGFDSHIEERLKEADCFVFPSIREGLGMAALEAMACGVPVIASDNRGTREYMESGKNGIVCKSDDVTEFMNAIVKMKEDFVFRRTASENAKITVQRFTVEASEGIMRSVYENV